MKFREILQRLDHSKAEKFYPNSEFCGEFNMDTYEIDYEKSKFYELPIIAWYCTDQFVGTNVITLNNNPLCISHQIGRKYDQKFKWINKETFEIAKNHMKELKLSEKESAISIMNLEVEISPYYRIEFAGQIISQWMKHGYFNNQKVSIEQIPSKDYIERRIKIIFENGEEEIVNVDKIEFPYLNLLTSE